MVWQFIEVFRKLKSSKETSFFSDRLNHRWTVSILITCCLLVVSSQYVGISISCWLPADFTSSMTSYANNVCWISNTYHVPTDTNIVPSNSRKYSVNYYQWVPYLLFTMAFFIYLPFFVWNILLKKNDIACYLIDELLSKNILSMEKTALNISRFINYRNKKISNFQGCKVKGIYSMLIQSSSLSLFYIITKIIYTLNGIFQIVFLDYFIPGYKFLGLRIIERWIKGNAFQNEEIFPRTSFCDFAIRTLGNNIQRFTVQCVLPINLFNEKIFIFIWFWFVFITIVNFISLIFLIKSLVKPSISNYIDIKEDNDDESDSIKSSKSNRKERSIRNFLSHDGILLLHILNENKNFIFTRNFLSLIWKFHKQK